MRHVTSEWWIKKEEGGPDSEPHRSLRLVACAMSDILGYLCFTSNQPIEFMISVLGLAHLAPHASLASNLNRTNISNSFSTYHNFSIPGFSTVTSILARHITSAVQHGTRIKTG